MNTPPDPATSILLEVYLPARPGDVAHGRTVTYLLPEPTAGDRSIIEPLYTATVRQVARLCDVDEHRAAELLLAYMCERFADDDAYRHRCDTLGVLAL